MLSWYHWLAIVLPVAGVLWTAARCRRYVRGVADFLVAGRVARRYVLRNGSMLANFSVLTVIAAVEAHYQAGFAMLFWNNLLLPLGIVMGLYGWISYRFRETGAMSCGQFLEMRYSRGVRLLAAVLRGTADALANCIGPAVAVRFFIYLLGIPHRLEIFGRTVPTFPVLLALCVGMALFVVLAGGRVSLLVTDALQGLFAYPLFLVLCVWIVTEFSWSSQISAVMSDRIPGESFLDPYDISELRDFNLFALFVTVFNRVFGGAWVGNGYGTSVGRSAHESRMAAVVGNFGSGFTWTFPVLVTLAVMTVMNHRDYTAEARAIRAELSARTADEIVGFDRPDLALAVVGRVEAIPESVHEIGTDAPLSRAANLDTPWLDAAHEAILGASDAPETANKTFQNYRTTWLQQMMPVAVRHVFPPWLVAMLALLCVLLVLSTDDTRIFDASTTWMQDFILPLMRKPPSPRAHVALFKLVVCFFGALFWCGSCFLAQMDYINMFVTVASSIWVAGAGAVVTGGLYWRRGTTAGAYTALVSGGALSAAGMFVQRSWQAVVFPWLSRNGLEAGLRRFLELASSPLRPWVDWRVADAAWPVKFPVNSMEINFVAGAAAVLLYFAVSLATCRKPFDLEKMLHREAALHRRVPRSPAAATGPLAAVARLARRIVGITPEFTRGDRAIAWGVFSWSIVYQFLVAFVGAAAASRVFRWGVSQWSRYFFVTTLAVPFVAGVVTTVWFSWGGVRDLKLLFRDLEERKRDDSDNGTVAR